MGDFALPSTIGGGLSVGVVERINEKFSNFLCWMPMLFVFCHAPVRFLRVIYDLELYLT